MWLDLSGQSCQPCTKQTESGGTQLLKSWQDCSFSLQLNGQHAAHQHYYFSPWFVPKHPFSRDKFCARDLQAEQIIVSESLFQYHLFQGLSVLALSSCEVPLRHWRGQKAFGWCGKERDHLVVPPSPPLALQGGVSPSQLGHHYSKLLWACSGRTLFPRLAVQLGKILLIVLLLNVHSIRPFGTAGDTQMWATLQTTVPPKQISEMQHSSTTTHFFLTS